MKAEHYLNRQITNASESVQGCGCLIVQLSGNDGNVYWRVLKDPANDFCDAVHFFEVDKLAAKL